MKKFQAPVLGGFRKMITLPPTTVGTTIAEIGAGTITLSQLAAAINNILTGSGTTTTGTANAANLVVGPGLTGGGPLVGNVPLRITAPIPWGMIDDGVDGDPGAQGPQGPRGLQGVPGQFLMPEDGQDGDWGPPGAAGAVGATGAQGPQGPAGSGTGSGGTGTLMMFIPDDHSYDDVLAMPGPTGPQGATGLTGATGAAAAGGAYFVADDQTSDDGIQAPMTGGPLVQAGSFVGTLTAMAATTTGTFVYTVLGGILCIICPTGTVTGTSTATNMSLTGMPQICQPARSQLLSAVVINDGTNVAGMLQVGPGAGAGNITFYAGITNVLTNYLDLSSTGFLSTGTKGLNVGAIVYQLN